MQKQTPGLRENCDVGPSTRKNYDHHSIEKNLITLHQFSNQAVVVAWIRLVQAPLAGSTCNVSVMWIPTIMCDGIYNNDVVAVVLNLCCCPFFFNTSTF